MASEGKIKHDDQGNFELVDDHQERAFLKETARKNREMQMAGQIQEMQDSEQIRDGVRQNLLDKLNQVIDDVDEDELE